MGNRWLVREQPPPERPPGGQRFLGVAVEWYLLLKITNKPTPDYNKSI